MFVYPFGDQETELTNIKVPWDLELEGAVKLQNINIATVLGWAQGAECSIAHMNSHPGVPVGLGSLGVWFCNQACCFSFPFADWPK